MVTPVGLDQELPVSLEDQLSQGPLSQPATGEETLCVPVLKNVVSDPPFVGGTFIPIDTTTLPIAGSQSTSMWMIPVIIAGIGIGVFVIMRVRK